MATESDDGSDRPADVVEPRSVDPPTEADLRSLLAGPLAEQTRAVADGYPVDEPTFDLDWWTLYDHDSDLAWGVVVHPVETLGATHKPRAGRLQEVLRDEYAEYLEGIPIRLSSLPPERTLRVGDLRTDMLGTLVDVDGEVVKVAAVEPWVQSAAYQCRMCGSETLAPQNYGLLWQPTQCPECESNKNQGIWQLNQDRSTLLDYQAALVAPSESSLDDPPVVRVILKEDLVGRIDQGDEVVVTGVYQTSPMDLQKETQLNVYLEGVALDIDEQVEADKVRASDLDQYIRDVIDEPDEYDVDDSSFGVDVDELAAAVHDTHGVREEEVRARVDEGFLDENPGYAQGGNRLFPDD